MEVSLIIPCHNLELYIQKCLDSILMQKNDMNISREIIFICDNCTDNTQKIIETNMKNSNWTYSIIVASEGSPGGARNRGLDAATGKYIWFIDGDDWLTCDNAIDILYECMIKDDMDIVQFKIKSNVSPQGQFGTGTVWQAMLSRRIIGNTRFNNRQNGEDNDFCHVVWNKKGVKFGRIALAPYFYNYPREGSLSDIAYNVYQRQDKVFALCATKNLYPYLYTVISSIYEHNSLKKIYLIIEDDKLNLPFNNIEYININTLNLNQKGANYNTGYTPMSLARLYLPQIIPDDKVLYLDVDLLILKDLSGLWDLDLNNYYCAGVLDKGIESFWNYIGKFEELSQQFNSNKYINSGVLLLNLAKIREDKKDQELINNIDQIKYAIGDQDCINQTLQDKIYLLNPRYNAGRHTQQEVADPIIYHWSGEKSNWVYKRENANLWRNQEEKLDKDFILKIN